MAEPALGALHRRRLREIWRSAGWPCQDTMEIELLAAGWVERLRDGHGRETLRVTDAGVLVLAATLNRNRAARDAHEALVGRVATEMQRAGRVVWRGLTLRSPVADVLSGPGGQLRPVSRWAMGMSGGHSLRHTTVNWPDGNGSSCARMTSTALASAGAPFNTTSATALLDAGIQGISPSFAQRPSRRC